MKITILEFIPEEKEIKKGYVDFKADYGNGKTETFRNITYFKKENRRWLAGPKINRNGQWIERYERTPPIAGLFREVLTALENYLVERNR